MKRYLLLTMVAIFFFMGLSAQQKTTIESVLNTPQIGAYVEVEGYVINYVPDPNGSYYVLRSEYGSVINVNAVDQPEPMFGKFIVKGLVQKDAFHAKPILVETSITQSDIPDGDSDGDGIPDSWEIHYRFDPNNPSDAFLDYDNDGFNNYQEYINGTDPHIANIPDPDKEWYKNPLYIALIVLVIILILVITLRKPQKSVKKNEERLQEISSPKESEPIPMAGGSPSYASIPETIIFPTYDPDDTTTRMFIPGRFIIVSEKDKGTEFIVAGFPTQEGGVVTIGRSKVDGAKGKSHIYLDGNHYPTVSRKQAEFIYDGKKVYVRNQSKVNLTQINGTPLESDDLKELKFGDIIKMGELELKYDK